MKMKNIGLASVLCMCMALPSYADIASGANSATCDNSTIGATEGSTDLEANWNANSITINWYNGDTKITTNTCSYDGAVTIPATPTKAGYTFAGWQVRVTPSITLEDCYRTTNDICSQCAELFPEAGFTGLLGYTKYPGTGSWVDGCCRTGVECGGG